MHEADMDRATTQRVDITQTHANCTYYRQNCGSCPAVTEYGAHADRPTLSRLVNEYWACFHGPALPHHPAETTENPPSPPRLSTGSLRVDDSDHNHVFIVGCSERRMDEGQRKQELKDDEYACEVEGWEYYPG